MVVTMVRFSMKWSKLEDTKNTYKYSKYKPQFHVAKGLKVAPYRWDDFICRHAHPEIHRPFKVLGSEGMAEPSPWNGRLSRRGNHYNSSPVHYRIRFSLALRLLVRCGSCRARHSIKHLLKLVEYFSISSICSHCWWFTMIKKLRFTKRVDHWQEVHWQEGRTEIDLGLYTGRFTPLLTSPYCFIVSASLAFCFSLYTPSCFEKVDTAKGNDWSYHHPNILLLCSFSLGTNWKNE